MNIEQCICHKAIHEPIEKKQYAIEMELGNMIVQVGGQEHKTTA